MFGVSERGSSTTPNSTRTDAFKGIPVEAAGGPITVEAAGAGITAAPAVKPRTYAGLPEVV